MPEAEIIEQEEHEERDEEEDSEWTEEEWKKYDESEADTPESEASDDDESTKPKPDPPIRAGSQFVDDEDPELDTQGDEEHEIERDSEYDDGGANETLDEEHSEE